MQENISVLVATIMAVILVVLFPVYNIATRNDSVANNVVIQATTNFVDEVRNKGYVTATDYGNFMNEISKTRNMFEVEMEIHEPMLLESQDSEDGEKKYEEKYKIKYTDEILKELNLEHNETEIASEDSIINENICTLDVDDKFYVRVKNTNLTQAQVLLGKLFGGATNERIVVNYGGIVYASEWAKGEDAEVANSNIFISRPLRPLENGQLEEYKHEYITTTYNPYTEEETEIYGIRVELTEEENSGIVKFILTYKDIYLFKEVDDDGNITTIGADDIYQRARESHVQSYVEGIGFKANVITVAEKSYGLNNKGLYNGQYEITLKDVVYDFDNDAYVRGKLKIKAGSAESKAGEIGQLTSKEFIFIYTINDVVLEEFKTKEVDDDNIPLLDINSTRRIVLADRTEDSLLEKKLTFITKAKINSPVASIKKVVLIIENLTDNKTETFEKEITERKNNVTLEADERVFKAGKYRVTAYAVDSRERKSNKYIMDFEVRERKQKTVKYPISRFEDAKINTITVDLDALKADGTLSSGDKWRIIEYKMEARFKWASEFYVGRGLSNSTYGPKYHIPTYKDWYNIVDSSNEKYEIIVPDKLPDNVDYRKTWVKEPYIDLGTSYYCNPYYYYPYGHFCRDNDNAIIYFPNASSILNYEGGKYITKDNSYYIQNYNSQVIIPQDAERAIGITASDYSKGGTIGSGYRDKEEDSFIKTGSLEEENITSLTFNYRIDPSHDWPGNGALNLTSIGSGLSVLVSDSRYIGNSYFCYAYAGEHSHHHYDSSGGTYLYTDCLNNSYLEVTVTYENSGY